MMLTQDQEPIEPKLNFGKVVQYVAYAKHYKRMDHQDAFSSRTVK